jgi:hypothetical protein
MTAGISKPFFLAPVMTSSQKNEVVSQWLQKAGAVAYSTLTDIPATQNRAMNLTHDATDYR